MTRRRKLDHEDKGSWGAAIRFWLARRGHTQAEVAALINARRRAAHRGPGTPRLVQRKTISSIVQGHDTQTRLLREIADVLDVSLEAVLYLPDEHAPAAWLGSPPQSLDYTRAMLRLFALQQGAPRTAMSAAVRELARVVMSLDLAPDARAPRPPKRPRRP